MDTNKVIYDLSLQAASTQLRSEIAEGKIQSDDILAIRNKTLEYFESYYDLYTSMDESNFCRINQLEI